MTKISTLGKLIFNSDNAAQVWLHVGSMDVGQQFLGSHVATELAFAPSIVYPLLNRLGTLGLIDTVEPPEYSPAKPYVRLENNLWAPLTSICQEIVRAEAIS